MKTGKKIVNLFLFLIITNFVYPQTTLLQTFSEKNIRGNSRFGQSTSNIGDINNDGFDDVIISSCGEVTDVGKAYVFFGGDSINTDNYLELTGNQTFGEKVAGIGDVNNDGFNDFMVGSLGRSNYDGRAYIFFGGNKPDNTADVILTGKTWFSTSISGAGDVNNDGYDDLIIAEQEFSNNKAYIYFGGQNIDNIPDVILNIDAHCYQYNMVVASAGDINNDGFDDVLVGNSKDFYGKVDLFFGGSSMNSVADITFKSKTKNNFFGSSLSSSGDINNDGYDDFLIGVKGDYDKSEGYVNLYLGGSIIDTLPSVKLQVENDIEFGNKVSSAGDINNDGYGDFLISTNNIGNVYLYLGNSSISNLTKITYPRSNPWAHWGLSISSAGDMNNDGFDDIMIGDFYHNHSNGKVDIYFGSDSIKTEIEETLLGFPTTNYFGRSVADAGDVNNDGYKDIIVGANKYNSVGAAYIYFGGETTNDSADIILLGNRMYSDFGLSVSSAGDFNRDGYDDVLVGAYKESLTGRVYLFFGGENMDNEPDLIFDGENNYEQFGVSTSIAGDLNNDGFDDIIIGAPSYNNSQGRVNVYFGNNLKDNTPDLKLIGKNENSRFGYSIANAGDVNNDGFDDIIIGAYRNNNNFGSAYIYLGAQTMNTIPDYSFFEEYTTYASYFGLSVSTAGDVNNDNFDDFIIGAPNYNNKDGRAYLYFGKNNITNTPDLILSGGNNEEFFSSSISDLGDVNNDGFEDVLIGAPFYDDSKGKVYIFYGNSMMDDVADIQIEGIENNSLFGQSTSKIGDVNGDENIEFIVGSHKTQPNGKAILYSFNNVTGRSQIFSTPKSYSLSQNYPNPFNPSTKIKFELPEAGNVKIEVFNQLGQRVKTIVDKHFDSGQHTITLNADDLSSGVYFYRIKSKNFLDSKKMLLIK